MILTEYVNSAKGSAGRLLKELGDAFDAKPKLASDILAVFNQPVPSNRMEAQTLAKCFALRYMQDPLFVEAEARQFAEGKLKQLKQDYPASYSAGEEMRDQPKPSGPRKIEKLKGPEPEKKKAKGPGVIETSAECAKHAKDRYDAIACIMSKLEVDKKRAVAYLSNALIRLEKEGETALVAKMKRK